MKFLILMLFTVSAFGAEVVKVPNAGFERGTIIWKPCGTWGGFNQVDKDKLLQIDTSNPRSGKKCLKVSDVWDNKSPYVIAAGVAAEQKSSYLVRAWVRADKPTKGGLVLMMMGEENGKDKFRGAKSEEFEATTEWTEVVLPVDYLSGNTKKLVLGLKPTRGDKANTGSIYFDDIRIESMSRADLNKLIVTELMPESKDLPKGVIQYRKIMTKFEREDKKKMPVEGCTVFAGSSSITMWYELEDDFKDINAVNRGFGGSGINHWLLVADRYLLKYKPAKIMYYCGENNIAAKTSVAKTVEMFEKLLKEVRTELPDVKFYYLAMKPSIRRFNLWPKMDEANQIIKAICEKSDKTYYVDVATPMFKADGTPRKDIFTSDNLHMNRKGYTELWIPTIRKALADTK